MTTRTLVLITSVSLLALGATGQVSAVQAEEESVKAASTTEIASASTIKLDVGSLVKFKTSVEAMKATLSQSDQQQLDVAFEKLAARSIAPAAGGDASASPANQGQNRTTVEIVYITMGDKLDGKTFEDILAMAG